MEEGFIKANSDNLPRIDVYTLMEFMSSNPSLNFKIKGLSLTKIVKEYYQDECIGYVQVKREEAQCIVKCKVASNYQIQTIYYQCTLTYDEAEENILSILCHDCAVQQACKHSLSFLIWLFKRSEEPETSSVKCYWTEPVVTKVCSDIKPFKSFIKAKELYCDETEYDETLETDVMPPTTNFNFVQKFIEECKKRNDYSPAIMKHFGYVRIEMKASLHLLLCDSKKEGDQITMENFIRFCERNITKEQCELIEKATKTGIDTELWYELQYGRIMDFVADEASKCKSRDEDLIENILFGFQFDQSLDTDEVKRLKDSIATEVQASHEINIDKCGLLLSPCYPAFGAAPYGLSKEHVIEIIHGVENVSEFSSSMDMSKYDAKVHLQMLFANKKKALLCAAQEDFVTSKHVNVYEIVYNEDYCQRLIKECETFWKFVFDTMTE